MSAVLFLLLVISSLLLLTFRFNYESDMCGLVLTGRADVDGSSVDLLSKKVILDGGRELAIGGGEALPEAVDELLRDVGEFDGNDIKKSQRIAYCNAAAASAVSDRQEFLSCYDNKMTFSL